MQIKIDDIIKNKLIEAAKVDGRSASNMARKIIEDHFKPRVAFQSNEIPEVNIEAKDPSAFLAERKRLKGGI